MLNVIFNRQALFFNTVNTYIVRLSLCLMQQKHYSLLLLALFWITAYACRNEKSELCLHIAAS